MPSDDSGVSAPLIVLVEVAIDDDVAGFCGCFRLAESEVTHEFGFHEGFGGGPEWGVAVAGFHVVHDKDAAVVWSPDVFVAIFDVSGKCGFDFGLAGEYLGRDFFI